MEFASYDKIFKKYWKYIYHFAHRKLDDWEVADDVAQNTFIKLWQRMDKMESEANCKCFLFICAKNECLNVIKQRRDFVTPEIVSDTLADSFDYDIINVEVVSFLFEKIEAMPDKRKAVIKLFFKGIKSNLIAKQLGITRKTALNQKLKALAQLREAVKLKFDI